LTNYTVNFWAVFDLPSDWPTTDSELSVCIGDYYDGYFDQYNFVRDFIDLNVVTLLTSS
jgi:hypothetical protein